MAFRVPPRPIGEPRTPQIKKRKRFESEEHAKFIRSLPCVVTNIYHGVQAAHVSYPDLRYGKFGRAFGKREDDCWIVPLCREQHDLQHDMNEKVFWQLAGIDPCRIAAALFVCSMFEDRDAALLVIQHAREP